ncbi:hypothetical protein FE257_010565 [Aspergillus nanangensis]|uniref:Uncharacterized protein n=1 Tax=Aspergillus nanangensis TaxID=2582783 RepID=A0AAD4CIH3_ASPNN|nr:hypothetical protein FE257_010565 [Aspergillus nanangensis]
MSAQDVSNPSVAAQFLQTEVYRLGAEPGLRSRPPGPERDFLTLTWGPFVYRTTYTSESNRYLPVFLQALNESIQKELHSLPGTPEQIHQLEKTYASRVFNAGDLYSEAPEACIRDSFHDWKVSQALPSIELPVRLRACLVVDENSLSFLAEMRERATGSEREADYSRCPVKIVEENFPDKYRKDSTPMAGLYPGWTTVALSSLVEVYNGLRNQDKGLGWYHRPGCMYTGNEQWEVESGMF